MLRNTLKESGDILIKDNAAVHGGYESQHVLDNLLDEYDVELDFQPAASSPELNPPCELVFSVIKRHIRNNRQIYQKLMSETFHALSTFTQEHDWCNEGWLPLDEDVEVVVVVAAGSIGVDRLLREEVLMTLSYWS